MAGSTTNFLWDREAGLPEIVDDGTTVTVQSPIGALGQFDAGSVVGAADYDAYGNLRTSSGSHSREGWAGEARDATTGLTHLRVRDYDPLTGRFTTADSESPNGALTQGYNAYHSTGNNPTTRTDPAGTNWLETIPAALQVLSEVVVVLVETLRLVMRSDVLPPWVKQFLGAVITFGLLMLMQTIVVILVVVALEVSGAGKFMVGRALVLSRLHTIGKMGQLAARCMGNQLCRNMARWLVQNPDCVIEAGSLAVSYGISGAPDPQSLTGQLAMGTDAAFLLKECVDRTPGRSHGGPPDSSCSFSGDTGVLMADGTRKPLAEIKVGDWVLAEDPETGMRGSRQVTHLWAHEDNLVDLDFDSEAVRTTEDHPFWNASDHAWQRADAIEPGESVLTADGDLLAVRGIDWATRTGGIAYNLTVADIHTYFVVVGEDEVLVHNTCPWNIRRNQEKGKAAELRAGIVEPKKQIKYKGGTIIPDYVGGKLVIEVKDVQKLGFTKQLRTYLEYAADHTLGFRLCTDLPKGKMSGPLREQIDLGTIEYRSIAECRR